MSGNDFLQYIEENKARISVLTAEIACKNEALAQWKQTVGNLTAEVERLREALSAYPTADDPLATADLVKCATFTAESKQRPMIYVEKALFDRLLKDKERLDWLEQRGSTGTFWSAWDGDKKRFVWVFSDCPNGRALDHAQDNLRAAIDAALGRQV